MTAPYNYIANLATLSDIPEDGILSRTIHNDAQIRVVYFGFAAGEELTEHTSAMPAILQIITGKARLTLAGDTLETQGGTWVYMPANLPHSVVAETPTVMLLLMLK